MRTAIAADPHAKGKDMGAVQAQLEAFEQACVQRHVDQAAFAGDIFGNSRVGDNRADTGAIGPIIARPLARMYRRHNIRSLLLPGNHDISGAGSADALHIFDEIDGITVAHEPSVFPIGGLPGVDVYCLPWSWAGNDPHEAIRDLLRRYPVGDKKTLLLGHAEIKGMRLTRYETESKKPGSWQLSREFLEGLPFDHIAFGHFHIRQSFCTGAFRQEDFGNEGNPAGFEIYDSETGKIEWVELDAAPRYRTVEVEPGQPMPKPGPNERLKIKLIGGKPEDIDRAGVKRLEETGVVIDHIAEREERIARADVPEGIVDDDHALIDLHAENQDPPIDGDRLARMHRLYNHRLKADAKVEKPEPAEAVAAPDEQDDLLLTGTTPFGLGNTTPF